MTALRERPAWKELERRLSGLPGADDAPVSRPKRRRLEPVEVARARRIAAIAPAKSTGMSERFEE